MPIDSVHPQYDHNVGRWEKVRDLARSRVRKYIEDVDPNDSKRNEQYKNRAQFTNFVARTRNGLIGQVFRRPMVAELPPSIEYIVDDATGQDVNLEKLAQEVTGEVLMSGRFGLLSDYPAVNEDLTLAEIERLNLKARIYKYNAESIINWKTEIVNGVPVLSMVVLKEDIAELNEDGFKWETRTQYRCLKIAGGRYIQILYRDKDDKEPLVFEPRNARGQPFDYIPFVFVGSEDNDAEVDPGPLYDIAELNIGHLKNSADYEEAIFIAGQPTLFITTEMSNQQFVEANPNGILLGSRKGYNLGANGSATLLQPNSVQLADEAMKRKEEQIIMMGGRISGQAAQNETAEAARGRHSGEASTLQVIRNNVNNAMIKACSYVLDYMGQESEQDQIQIHINDDFFEKAIDSNKIMAHLQLYNANIIAKSDLRDMLRRFNEIDPGRSDEDIEENLSNDVDALIPFGA